MSKFWTHILEFSQQLADQVGEQLLQDFGGALAREKQDGSLVTASDQWADQYLQKAIRTAFPEHGYLSEELQHTFPDTPWCWVVDPLDGTTNFARGIPIWGTSIALLYMGMPVFGLVHLPPLRQTYYGFWGEVIMDQQPHPEGAWRNQQRISTSTADLGPNQLFNFCSRSTHRITPQFPCKVRMLGGAAYNMLLVASGTFLGAVEQTPKVWDIAAVWVIVQAAGGVWIPLDDRPPFPLHPGQDYGRQSFPTLILSQERHRSVLQPYMI